jgi:diguanylate cyclase (GGDEF)-like protein/PAS domain S-box-containing protein
MAVHVCPDRRGYPMTATPRGRFIATVIAVYAISALAWIFLSDLLLAAFTDIGAILWLSTAKGVFFVVVTAAMFFFGLKSVPERDARAGQTLIDALNGGITVRVNRWPMYVFAVVVSLSMLVFRVNMASERSERLMLILFMLPVILSALLGGLGPGLVSTAVAAAGSNYLSIPPVHSLRIASNDDLLQWCALIVNGVAVSLLSEMLRRSKARMEEKSSLLDAIVSGTPDAVFIKDLRGRYLLVNQAAAQFIGRPVAAILGHDDRQLFPEPTARLLQETDRAVVDRGRTQTHEEHLLTLDGKMLDFWVTKGPIRDGAGKPVGLFGISRDITDKKLVADALLEREQKLARVLEGSEQGYWDWNLQTNHFEVSARWEQMLGFESGEMNVSPQNWPNLVHPDDLPATLESIQTHVKGDTPSYESEFRAHTKSGAWRWISTRGRVMSRSADGRALVMSGTHTDVTERKLFEMAQKEAATVFSSSYEGIMVVSRQMLITKINPAFTRITGYSAADVLGQPPSILSSGKQDPAFYRTMWDALAHHNFWSGEVWNRRKDGELYAELLSISAVRDTHGEVQHYVGVFSDISQLKAHEAELDRIAHYDPLTGTPNRRLLADRLEQAIARCARNGHSLAVCFLDLDGFKEVNDRYGHAAGDALLVGVTRNLQHILRADDTLARMGGDEFVLLLSNIATPEECSLILERVLQATGEPVTIDGHAITISASIGVSLYPTDHADADALLRHADQAMYLAKEGGKNRFHLFDPEHDRKAQVHRKFVDTLRNALDNGEFVLHFQPKVHLVSGQLIGVEALIRWQHPERGLLPPIEFLPFLNGSALEKPLGEWVIHAALAQATDWSRLGMPVSVSVNISASHLLHPDFYDYLQGMLERHGDVPANTFELEVLETAALADMDQAVAILQRCRELGVHFALDDFGTGYSSLTYLRKLPVDLLKIDQSFVRDMLVDADDMGIVEGVIRLAGAFNRQVIAEGVETMEHGAALLRLGCHLAQGYGIAKPMPAQELFPWLARWQRDAAWVGLNAGAFGAPLASAQGLEQV